MKRILFILSLLIIGLFSQAQYPITQSIGSDSAMVKAKAGIWGGKGVVNGVYADTATANLNRIRQYAGAQIFTTDSNRLWVRNGAVTRWLQSGGSGSGTITFFEFLTDSSLVICYSDGSCDTLSFANNVFVTNNSIGCNSLLEGGIVSYRGTGMVFDVTTALYNINCNTYSSPLTVTTLANGDASNPRIDVFAVDTNGVVVVLQGTPAANPVKPQIDPASQLELTSILIPTGATTPTGLTIEAIYNENTGTPTEWNTSQSNWTPTVSADFNNTANPFLGSKDILISTTGTPTSSSYLSFIAGDTLQYSFGWNLLKLYLSLNTTMTTGQGFSFQLYFRGNPASEVVNLFPGSYTFSGSFTSSYQPVIVPWGAFIPTDTAFNQLVIRPINGTKGFYFDYITIQAGLDDSSLVSSGRWIENQYSYDQPANFRIQGIGQANMWFTSPNPLYNGSEKYGRNSTVVAVEGTAIGFQSVVTAFGGTALGSQSTSAGGIAIGYNATSGGQSNVAIGGNTSTISGATQVGRDGSVTANYGTVIGQSATTAFEKSIGIGYFATPKAANQFVVGDENGIVNSFYLGSAGADTSSTATNVSWGITGIGGTNQSGKTLTIFAGAGTGNTTTGSIIDFQTSDATSSGAVPQALSTKFRILQSGQLRALNYGDGTFSGTPTYVIGSDADGNLIEWPPGGIGGGILTDADNGLSLRSSTIAVLGQNIGEVGNPAVLLSSREIPLANFTLNFNADAAQTNNMTVWNNASAAVRARITSAAEFSNNGGQTNSEQFGAGALSSGGQQVIIGRLALGGTGTSNTVVGYNSSVSNGLNSVTIVGSSVTNTTVGFTTLVGAAITSSGRSTGIGAQSTYSGLNNFGLGEQVSVSHTYSGAIGFGATTTADNQLVLGDNVNSGTEGGINDIYWGEGVLSEAPNNVSLNANSGLGTNVAPGILTINASRGTGNASTNGYIDFSTSDAGASGTTLQSLTTKFRILKTGQLRALNYGDGTYSGTATYLIASDVDGNFIEYPPGGIGGGGVVVTADNGLTKNTATNVQLGGTLLANTTINSTSGFILTVTGSADSYVTIPLFVQNTNNGNALQVATSGGAGDKAPILSQTNGTSATVLRGIDLYNGTANADGMGISLNFKNRTSSALGSSDNTISNRIISKWITSDNDTRVSQFIITGVNKAATDNLLIMGDRVTLTESSASTFASTTIPSNGNGGGEITVTVMADDGTEFQTRTLRFIWSAANKAGTTDVDISTPEESVSISSGTLTVTITAVDAGSGVVNFQANAVSSLTQTTLRCSYQISKNF